MEDDGMIPCCVDSRIYNQWKASQPPRVYYARGRYRGGVSTIQYRGDVIHPDLYTSPVYPQYRRLLHMTSKVQPPIYSVSSVNQPSIIMMLCGRRSYHIMMIDLE
jgi:hypothetical protein